MNKEILKISLAKIGFLARCFAAVTCISLCVSFGVARVSISYAVDFDNRVIKNRIASFDNMQLPQKINITGKYGKEINALYQKTDNNIIKSILLDGEVTDEEYTLVNELLVYPCMFDKGFKVVKNADNSITLFPVDATAWSNPIAINNAAMEARGDCDSFNSSVPISEVRDIKQNLDGTPREGQTEESNVKIAQCLVDKNLIDSNHAYGHTPIEMLIFIWENRDDKNPYDTNLISSITSCSPNLTFVGEELDHPRIWRKYI
jgi:hypothetical protein